MKLKTQTVALFVILLLNITSACNTFKDEMTSGPFVEVAKEMDGTWQLNSVTRNGTDISDDMEFDQFRLILNSDSTYVIENYLPFIVKENGVWQVDNVMFPFFLTFQEDGATESVQTEITYPIVEGKRHITLTISPGCSSNSYVYSFEKIEND